MTSSARLVSFLLALAPAVAACASTGRAATAGGAPASGVGAAVLAAHHAWWQAFVNADTARLAPLTSPVFSLTLSSGTTFDRAATLAQAASYPPGAGLGIDWADEAVRPLGPGAVLVASRGSEAVGQTTQAYRYSAVLQEVGGTWRMSAAQTTRVAAFTPRVSAAVAGPLGDYAGEYRTPRGLALRIAVRDSILVLTEPSGKELPLEPIGPGLFEFAVLSPANGVVRFAFTRDPTGRVTALNQLAPGAVNRFPRIQR